MARVNSVPLRSFLRHSANSVTKFLIIIVFALYSQVARADTNIIDFLNAALAKKSILLNRTRVIHREKIVCGWVGEGGHRHKDCQTFDDPHTETYSDQARVKTQQVISTSELQFDKSNIDTLPATALIERIDYVNCGEDPTTTTYALKLIGTKGSQVTKTHTVSSTFGLTVSDKFEASVGIFGGETTVAVNTSLTLSDSTTKQESQSNTEERDWTTAITVAVGHAGYLQLLVLQETVRVPFSATVIVDGDLEDNTSGYTKASQFLTEAERTLPFSGTLQAEGLSGAATGNFKPDAPFDCGNPKYRGQYFESKKNSAVPWSPKMFKKVLGPSTTQRQIDYQK